VQKTFYTVEFIAPVEVRGTNLTIGTDFASDGVDHRMIYETGGIRLPPPNSPWAAIDGNFGLEIAGYLSRIAELPGEDYLFRFYLHDPWWLNSPWLDRYERQPHDIWLPTACSRIDETGSVHNPRYLNILSADNFEHGSYCSHISYTGALTDGGLDSVVAAPDSETTSEITAHADTNERVLALTVKRRRWNGGSVFWTRGRDCSRKALPPDDTVKADTSVRVQEFPLA